MARVNQRLWKIPGQRTKRKAWGFTVQLVGGKRVRSYKAEWTKEDAEKALAAVQLQIAPTKPQSGLTLAAAVESYLAAKVRKKSLAFDKLYLRQITSAFGAETTLAEITGAKINAWKAMKLAAINTRTGEPYSAAAINRPLQALRHLMRLAHEEGTLAVVPKIRLEREPQGRLRWLTQDEEARLLDACRRSRSPELLDFVTIALETGLRRGELLGLTWDRVDLTRGVIRLEVTKSGKRREIPMRQVVYNILAARPEPRDGRVFKARSIRTAFESAVKAAGIEDFHTHDCRHHFASWFVMRGGSLQALKEILGHADLKMTLRYAHLSPDHLRGEITKTERQPTRDAKRSAQEMAQEPVGKIVAEELSRKSLF